MAMTNAENLTQLFELLDKAIILSSEFSGGCSTNFLSVEAFHATLADSVSAFKAGDHHQMLKLYF